MKSYFSYQEDEAYREGRKDESMHRHNYERDRYSDRDEDRAYFEGRKDQEREDERREEQRREEREQEDAEERRYYEKIQRRQAEEEYNIEEMRSEEEMHLRMITNIQPEPNIEENLSEALKNVQEELLEKSIDNEFPISEEDFWYLLQQDELESLDKKS